MLECGRGDIAKRAMWTHLVVVSLPVADDAPSVGQILKPVLVQTAVSEASVEAFNKSVLAGLARLDEMQLDPAFVAPEEHGFAGHLRTVIEHQCAWSTTTRDDLIEPPHHPGAGDTNIHELSNTQARIVVDNVQDPDASATGELVVNEVR